MDENNTITVMQSSQSDHFKLHVKDNEIEVHVNNYNTFQSSVSNDNYFVGEIKYRNSSLDGYGQWNILDTDHVKNDKTSKLGIYFKRKLHITLKHGGEVIFFKHFGQTLKKMSEGKTPNMIVYGTDSEVVTCGLWQFGFVACGL